MKATQSPVMSDSPSDPAIPSDTPTLAVVLRRNPQSPPLAKEIVTDVDLNDARAELWRDGVLRKGYPDTRIEDLTFRLRPVFARDTATRCTGYILETNNPGGALARRAFSIYSLSLVANRRARGLVDLGALENVETYYYELVVEPAAAPIVETDSAPDAGKITIKPNPPQYLRVPMARLLKGARRIGSEDDDSFPVFYTRSALAKAERFSRKGANLIPPIETGACLIGILFSCPDSGEFGLIVMDALEVLDSEGTKFSLSYTGQSWARIQTVVRAMQSAHPKRAFHLCGNGHGHNWLPNDGVTCAECLKRDQCSATSVFASMDDRLWMSAVHTREPFSICHVFGRVARGDLVQALYGLQDARLVERSYWVIPGFDPAPYEK